MSLGGASFCTASTSTCIDEADADADARACRPTPATARCRPPAATAGTCRAVVTAVPAIGNGLVAADPADRPAGEDAGAEQAGHQRQHPQAGAGRADAVDELQEQRDEDDRAEHRQADQEAERRGDAEHARAEQLQRDDRLGGAALGEHEGDQQQRRRRAPVRGSCPSPTRYSLPPQVVTRISALTPAVSSAAPSQSICVAVRRRVQVQPGDHDQRPRPAPNGMFT